MARAEAAGSAASAPAAPRLHVSVVYAPAPHRIDQVDLRLPHGATLADALRASGIAERHGLDPLACSAGIWGRVQPNDTPLRERDRVEVYRELLVDPKEARRQRYKGQRKATRDGTREASRDKPREG